MNKLLTTTALSLLLISTAGVSYGQSVICESYSGGFNKPQQIFERRCPGGYREVGRVGSSSSGLPFEELAEGIREGIDKSNEALRQSISRSRSQAQANSQTRKQVAMSTFATAMGTLTPPISNYQWDQIKDLASEISRDFERALVAYESWRGGRFSGTVEGGDFGLYARDMDVNELGLFSVATMALERIMDLEDRGSFGLIIEEGRYITVVDLVLGGPMERTGIKVGEQIVAFGIGNEAVTSTRRMERWQFLGFLSSAPGQEMKFQIIPSGSRDVSSSRTVRVTPERRDIQTGQWYAINPVTPVAANSNNTQDNERANDLVDGLNNLSDLHTQGILTDEEFNAAKRRLLGL